MYGEPVSERDLYDLEPGDIEPEHVFAVEDEDEQDQAGADETPGAWNRPA